MSVLMRLLIRPTPGFDRRNNEWGSDSSWICVGFDLQQYSGKFFGLQKGKVFLDEQCVDFYRSFGDRLPIKKMANRRSGAMDVYAPICPSVLYWMREPEKGSDQALIIPVNIQSNLIDGRDGEFVLIT
jgi:hypothetical protein